jgi:exopolysaccharide biosynthesis WecB/TagA/CpsF family protein
LTIRSSSDIDAAISAPSQPLDTLPTTVDIDGIPIHRLAFVETVGLLARWAEAGSGGYVCTPNVDHIVRARLDAPFRAALLGARLRVPDGMGIVYGSRLARRPLPGTVTGRLLPEAVGRQLRGSGCAIALIGGRPGMAQSAARKLKQASVPIAAAVGPSMDFRIDSDEDRAAVRAIRESRARVVFVGLGAPKQELWMARHVNDLPNTVFVGVGMAIDALGGRLRVPPRWMTRVGLEWAFRLAMEPRRLARRYLRDDPPFFWWMTRAGMDRGRRVERD